MTDRGVSITLNYALTLMIAVLLMVGLLMSIGDVLETRRESSAQAELQVIGQQVAADLMTADRMVLAGGDHVAIQSSIPWTVAGVQYVIEVNATNDGSGLLLQTEQVEEQVHISFHNTTPFEQTEISGGSFEVILNDDGKLEVRQA